MSADLTLLTAGQSSTHRRPSKPMLLSLLCFRLQIASPQLCKRFEATRKVLRPNPD